MIQEIPASMRTLKKELEYMQAKSRGESLDITTLKHHNFWDMKLIPNGFEYDTLFNVNDMLVAMPNDQFLVWWMRVGLALEAGAIPYDQFIYNIGKRQSQPHVPHGHIVKFKKRKEFEL